ncbi:C40 family peptidase [Collimonas humicola]|uniref:C40 family peptidase n=1 Tax=Collimonas humicola TaxID=2825886 RepID=UPI001B8BDB85|nr:Mov34/MPN/PAD-1 family protein [Collimonas humicola]
MTPETLQAIRDHARDDFPRESCGLVLVRKGRERYVPCRNIASGNDHFTIHPADYSAAQDAGTITCIVHSHPNVSPQPSEADLVSCEKSGVPWLIVNWPTGAIHEFAPSGYQAPLVGRQFSYNVLDCYKLIQDYYERTLSIALPDFPHPDRFWETGGNMYMENFAKAGFVGVDTIEKHDVLLMQIGASTPNHGAIYLGESRILQHLMHRLSSIDAWGGYWEKCTIKIIRHKELLCAK